MIDQLKIYRRELHQIPELGFDLDLTHAYVKEKLISFGYEIIVTAKTGIIARRLGESLDAIAFRSDMDALPVKELTKVDFESKFDGRMHACGHDGHMAMLLQFAKEVSLIKNLKKSVVFIFQPAEEGPGGAKLIVESGIFEKYHIKKIFGIHLYPNLDEGLYGLVDGPMMAQNGEFTIEIMGKSAHAAQPHLGNDAILASAHLVQAYNEIVSRYIDPLEPAVLTVGTFNGGEARNIIANHVTLMGTIRTFNEKIHEVIKQRMLDIQKGIEQIYHVSIKSDIIDYYPAVINDSKIFSKLKESLDQASYELIKPMMFAEDFSFYQRKVPGMFVMLGTKNEKLGYTHPLHSCYFNFKEEVLIKGVELYLHILKLYEII